MWDQMFVEDVCDDEPAPGPGPGLELEVETPDSDLGRKTTYR